MSDREDAQEPPKSDSNIIVDLEASYKTKTAEDKEQCQSRSQKPLAITDIVEILNDDDDARACDSSMCESERRSIACLDSRVQAAIHRLPRLTRESRHRIGSSTEGRSSPQKSGHCAGPILRSSQWSQLYTARRFRSGRGLDHTGSVPSQYNDRDRDPSTR